MISYELAKKLKEAGFYNKYEKINKENNKKKFLKLKGVLTFGQPDLSPTLSELIEACGDKIQVIYFGNECGAESFETGDRGRGDTPEEAVANLWLEINERKEN